MKPNLCNKFANFDRILQFCVFYFMFVRIGIGLKYWLLDISTILKCGNQYNTSYKFTKYQL